MYKWKKTLSFVMAFALLASSSPTVAAVTADKLSALSIQASAADLYISDDFEYADYGSYLEIRGYEGDSPILTIPDEINEKPVTRIADSAFADKKKYGSLQEITIPESIEYIGANAFAGCTDVQVGYIPTKFIAICAAAKQITVSENVTELVSFEIQDNKTTKVTTIDGLASIYTEYTIDNTTLGKRALAIPSKVKEADIDNLSKETLESFVQEYSTIEKVEINNRNCAIAKGSIPENAIVRGYRVSTARTYADENSRKFEPIDGWGDEETIKENIKLNMTHSEIENSKFHFVVEADTDGYNVLRIGVIVDKHNSVTEETAKELMTFDSGLEGKVTGVRKNANDYHVDISEEGLGLWVVSYVVVDDGSGKEIVKYGEPVFVYSQETIKSFVDVKIADLETAERRDGSLGVKTTVTSNNDKYTLVRTGVVADKNGIVTKDTAKELLTLDSELEGKTVGGKLQDEYVVNVADEGNGVWIAGFVTVSLNGHEVTKYTAPAYKSTSDVLDDVSVVLNDTALSATKFRFDASSELINDTEVKIVKTGILTSKTGALNEETVATSLQVGSDFSEKQSFVDEGTSCAVELSDIGNGIWAVGYVTIEVNGKEVTKYTEPKYVYSEVQMKEDVSVNITVGDEFVDDGKTKHRFDVVSRTTGAEILRTGIIIDKNEKVTADTAASLLTLDSTLSGKVKGEWDGKSLYAANVAKVSGKGVWAVGYVVTLDENGKEVVTYSEPIYANTHEDVIKANMSVNIVYSDVENEPAKRRFDVSATTGDVIVEKIGVIVDKNDSVTSENVTDKLAFTNLSSLTPVLSGAVVGTWEEKNVYSANIKMTGKGLWVVGYAIIDINGQKFVKYTDPVRIEQN